MGKSRPCISTGKSRLGPAPCHRGAPGGLALGPGEVGKGTVVLSMKAPWSRGWPGGCGWSGSHWGGRASRDSLTQLSGGGPSRSARPHGVKASTTENKRQGQTAQLVPVWGGLSALALPFLLSPPGSLPAPFLSASADPELPPGHRTLRCLIPSNGSECIVTALLKTGIPDPLQVKEGRKNQTDFMLWDGTSEDRGNYSCVYYQCHWPHLGSSRSSSLEVQETGEDSG